MNAIDKCIPKTQGQHPGEWHAACVSWIDSTSGAVMVSVRHVATGHVSQVEIGDVVFSNDAQTYFDTRPAVVSSAPIPSAPSLTAPARVIPSAQFAGRWSGTMTPGRYRMFWLGSQQVVEVSRAADGEMMVTPELGDPMRLADTVQAQFMAEVAA